MYTKNELYKIIKKDLEGITKDLKDYKLYTIEQLIVIANKLDDINNIE